MLPICTFLYNQPVEFILSGKQKQAQLGKLIFPHSVLEEEENIFAFRTFLFVPYVLLFLPSFSRFCCTICLEFVMNMGYTTPLTLAHQRH
jgi:hypothetical protein